MSKYRIVQEGTNTFFIEDRLFRFFIPIWMRDYKNVFSSFDEADLFVKERLQRESFNPKVIKYYP